MPNELRGPPKVLSRRKAHSFSDVAKKVVSIINLASVAAVETATGAAVDPLRFRGNIYVSGWPAWHEFDLLGARASDRRRAAEGRQAHRALRRDQCRSGDRHPRPDDPEDPAAEPSATPIAASMPKSSAGGDIADRRHGSNDRRANRTLGVMPLDAPVAAQAGSRRLRSAAAGDRSWRAASRPPCGTARCARPVRGMRCTARWRCAAAAAARRGSAHALQRSGDNERASARARRVRRAPGVLSRRRWRSALDGGKQFGNRRGWRAHRLAHGRRHVRAQAAW